MFFLDIYVFNILPGWTITLRGYHSRSVGTGMTYLSVCWLMSFAFPLGRLFGFGNFVITLIYSNINVIKPAHAVTSIKQSPVLKSHLFLVLPYLISFEFNLF